MQGKEIIVKIRDITKYFVISIYELLGFILHTLAYRGSYEVKAFADSWTNPSLFQDGLLPIKRVVTKVNQYLFDSRLALSS